MSGPTGIRWSFGKLSSVLAEIHGIHPTKLTAFQSRLKNLHRLKFPMGFIMDKGRAAMYAPEDALMMALAVEMTQLGLTPERTVRVLSANWYPTNMAILLAARALTADAVLAAHGRSDEIPPPSPMFIFFDPAGLDTLTREFDEPAPALDDVAAESYFYGGLGVIQERLADWTSSHVSRVSMINVSSLIDRLAGSPFGDDWEGNVRWRVRFFRELRDWADRFEANNISGGKKRFLAWWIEHCVGWPPSRSFNDDVQFVEDHTGANPEIIKQVLGRFRDQKRRQDGRPQA